MIKHEIDKLRAAGGVTALGESVGVGVGGGGSGGGGHDDIFNRALEANGGMSPSPGGAGRGGMGRDAAGGGGGDNAHIHSRAQTPQGDMGYDPPTLDPGLSPAQIAQIRATAGPDDLPPVMSQGNFGGSYDDRPAASKASIAEGGTPSRFREADPSAQGETNDEVGGVGGGVYVRDPKLSCATHPILARTCS